MHNYCIMSGRQSCSFKALEPTFILYHLQHLFKISENISFAKVMEYILYNTGNFSEKTGQNVCTFSFELIIYLDNIYSLYSHHILLSSNGDKVFIHRPTGTKDYNLTYEFIGTVNPSPLFFLLT